MYVLGISGGLDYLYEKRFEIDEGTCHDSAAAIVSANKVLAAIEEERLNRIKHSNKAPINAIRYCLEAAALKLNRVDAIAVAGDEKWLNTALKKYYTDNPEENTQRYIGDEYLKMFEKVFSAGMEKNKVCYVPHHIAHAASAYAMSGFGECLIITIDGAGDDVSGMVIDVRNGEWKIIDTIPIGNSLGFFYVDVIKYLGYKMFDEYKVMGLAPYGDPAVYRKVMSGLYSLKERGRFSINSQLIPLLSNFILPRRKHQPLLKTHKDLAASLQEALENIIFHMLSWYKNETKHENLCMAGGVVHNSTVNGKIYYAGLFKNLFFHPAAHDAGCALGAAIYINNGMSFKQNSGRTPQTIYLGPHLPGNDSIKETLFKWSDFLVYEKSNNVALEAAQLLAEDYVIGWVQGKSEFGPRALGNRSILADPRPEENKEKINAMIKKREGYRPFAPSVLEEYAAEYFELPTGSTAEDFKYMIAVLNVIPEKRKILNAVTHVDGTARIQTVSKQDNPLYWELINEFNKISGIPVVLNTSFNNNVEPIVDSMDDAIVSFLTTGLHYLVIADYIITKKEFPLTVYKSLICECRPYARIGETVEYISETERGVKYMISANFTDKYNTNISCETYLFLKACTGRMNVMHIMDSLQFNDCQGRILLEELLILWNLRLIKLFPDKGVNNA